jgi:hypothetical protein
VPLFSRFCEENKSSHETDLLFLEKSEKIIANGSTIIQLGSEYSFQNDSNGGLSIAIAFTMEDPAEPMAEVYFGR